MKKIVVVLLSCIYLTSYSQNINDAYDDHPTPTPSHWNNDEFFNFNGEYQIFLDKFFWNAEFGNGGNVLQDADVSFRIEVVSFPFIPEDLDPDTHNDFTDYEDRVLNTDFVSDNNYNYGSLYSSNHPAEVDYKGIGWQFGDYRIFQKVYNINTCDLSGVDFKCAGDYGLISQVYANAIQDDYYEQCHLPHTVLKHTIYFHCTDPEDPQNNPIIDSISWIYDNTRGAMREYPFQNPSTKSFPPNPTVYDVCFRPTFPELGVYFYGPNTSNKGWYDSGFKPTIDATGSVDYFPPSEVLPHYDVCSFYPLYYSPSPPSYPTIYINYLSNYFDSELVHPPSYILLDAPLLNAVGGEYAGYGTTGYKLETDGIEHRYEINDPFDLRIINSKEKIIYNPYEVRINCDLTFPCHYQFRTLHGKYPDKVNEVRNGDYSSDYWDQIPYFDFEYERDYPIPVNCTTNTECKSTYILGGATIIIEPCVIIMDATFKGQNSGLGKGTIIYDPDRTFGNWEYEPETINLIPINWNTYHETQYHSSCICVNSSIEGGGKSFNSNEEREIIEPEKSDDQIIIFNSGSNSPVIQIKAKEFKNYYLKIFDSFGKIVSENNIEYFGQAFDYSDYKKGIYHAVLLINGKVVEKESFAKL